MDFYIFDMVDSLVPIIFNVAIIILNTTTAFLIIFLLAFNKKIKILPVSHKIGLWIGMMGLIGQSYRNVIFLLTNVSPNDNDIAIWVLKDMGYWVIAFTILYSLINIKKDTKCN